MEAMDHATVTFPVVNEMLLSDDVQASEGEMGVVEEPQSFVFSSSEGTTTTLLSLPFALLQDSGLISTSSGAPEGSTANTTNIIIKQSASSHQGGHLPSNTIFLDAAQMALLSSGGGHVVLTDAYLEEGSGGEASEVTQQIFLQAIRGLTEVCDFVLLQ
ncbi:uncharacterized protein LOC124170063 [Ischnura elegans]|uniref:uncharacterized protein LOC124170063 n=1 Tax=Ischnura elegans TaxID=197161 RepID=UPI001ED8B85E|nr:uncharacterized protein LOC124170063 [Ischnura elegans]